MTSSLSFSLGALLRQTVSSAQTTLSNDELELSTGTFANIGLQLGAETGQDVSLRAQNALLGALTASNATVSTTIASSQNILSNLQTTAQNFLQSLIQSGNTGNSTASELQSTASANLQTLVNQLNTNVNGQFIFGGTNSGAQPIAAFTPGSSASSNAVDSAFSAAFGISQSSPSVSTISPTQMQSFLTTQFPSLFQDPAWTTNWSSASDTPITTQISPSQTVVTSVSANQSAFQDLAQAYTMVSDLGTSNLSAQTFQTVVQQAETVVQSGINGLINLQTNLGDSQSAITAADNFMTTQSTTLSTQVGSLENVNQFAVETQANDLQTQIETAFELTSQIQQLSLTKFLPA